jgi:nitrite reductase (NADH) small subunit
MLDQETFHGGGSMTPAAKVSEIPNFGKKVITVSGQEILFINIKGSIFAVENECPHQSSPLTAAVVKDGYIACPRHGYRFNLADGSCSDHPEFILKTYPVELSGDDILVDLG